MSAYKNLLFAMLVVALWLGHSGPVRGQTQTRDELDASYFLDAHAWVVYGSVAGLGGMYLFMDVADPPRLFDPDEGGAEYRGSTVPTYAVGVFAGAVGLGLVAAPTDARWYHVKGFAESVSTTLLATELSKRFFGRHRPDYVEGDPVTGTDKGRRSFFSGHSSLTLASTTYLGLYLRQHVFPTWKGDAGLPWWEVASYAGLAGISVYVPVSRITDHRHHKTDVLVGSLVGASMSAVFYTWQERRFERRAATRRLDMALVPTGEPLGVAFAGMF